MSLMINYCSVVLVNHKMPICLFSSTTLVLWHCFWSITRCLFVCFLLLHLFCGIVSGQSQDAYLFVFFYYTCFVALFLTGIHCFWLASIVTFIKAMKYKISHQPTKESMWVCINKARNYTKSCNLHCQWELCLPVFVWWTFVVLYICMKNCCIVHMFGWPQGR